MSQEDYFPRLEDESGCGIMPVLRINEGWLDLTFVRPYEHAVFDLAKSFPKPFNPSSALLSPLPVQVTAR